MASQEPTLVLVPGSFNYPAIYNPLIEKFASLGHSIQTVDLLSVGKKPGAPPTIYDDAAHIASAVTKLADEGKDIVLVGHSYAGIPISQSMQGLSKAARAKGGKKGGVVRIAYITALVPAVGESATATLEGCPSGYIQPDEEGWMHHFDLALTAKYVFSDLSPEEGVKWVEQFSQHSAVSFGNELTYAGYNDVPASYLFCETDECVVPASQQRAIDVIEKTSGKKVDVTKIRSDHCPNASHSEWVIDWFVDLVKKGGSE